MPAKLFKNLKDDAIKVFHSMCQKIWKRQQWPEDRKRSILIPIMKKGSTKECSRNRTVAVISHASKVMLKILQARLQHYVNLELPYVQPGFRKSRWTRYQIGNTCWNTEKARQFQKKHLLHWPQQNVWITTKWKILKEMGIPDQPYPSYEKPVCSSKSSS